MPSDGSVVPTDLLIERLMVQNFVAIPSPTIRRDAFLAIGGMDVGLWYTADWDLYLKLAATGPVTYDDGAYACFRVHEASQTMSGSRHRADFGAQLLCVIDRHGPRLPVRHRETVMRAARASVAINTALAGANNGCLADITVALRALLGLGPMGMRRYFRDSRLVERVLQKGGAALITADHGNAEVMVDETGGPHTAHTCDMAPVVLVDDSRKGAKLRKGVLADLAPTMLEMLGLAQPAEMTGKSLLVG